VDLGLEVENARVKTGPSRRNEVQPLPKTYIVLFTPANVKRPDGVQERITQAANYTENFLITWMKHWGYPPNREKVFERTSDRQVQVFYVEGKGTTEQYRKPSPALSDEVRTTAMSMYNVKRHRHVWWVWVYLGDPPERFRDWRGGGDPTNGGMGSVNYSTWPGEIRLTEELGCPFLTKIALHGCIHELGHAFGLPHDGPLAKADLGIPLMGATIANFRRRTGTDEERAYLSEASAAILWKHPIFSGTAERRNEMPTCDLHLLGLDNDHRERVVHVKGQLKASIPAHSVVIYDSVPYDQETYWQKPYVARIDGNGCFNVAITEPTHSQGKLRIVFCFENGVVTGDGHRHGINGAVEKLYLGTATGYHLLD
jgi:hypothetical protein